MASLTALPRTFAPPRGAHTVVAGAVFLALAVGALVTVKPMFAIALIGAAIVGLVVAQNVSYLPYFLVFTMFIESVSLGPGLRVGRVAGAMALLVLALTLLTRGRAGLRPSPLLAVAGAYGLWIFASAEWASSRHTVPVVGFSYILSASYALTFAVLLRKRSQLFGLGKVLALGSAVFGLVSFVYYMRHIGSVPADDAAGARGAGLQGDPNYFAIFQVIALPPALVLAASARTAWRFVYYGVVGIIVLSVVSSLSRTGLIALTIAVLLTLLLPWRIFFSAASQKLTYLVAIVASGALAAVVGSTALIQRVQTILDPNAQGSYRGAGRQDLWRAALTGWHRSHEWIGMGAGNFKLYSLDLLQTTPGVDTTQNYAQNAREVHNAYLENLTDLGIIGLALFVLILLLTARSFLQSFRRARAAGDLDLERFSLAFLVSLSGYALSAMFLSNQLAKALWILVGLALALEVMTRRAVPAAALAAGGETYDEAVARGEIEQLERRLQAMQQRLVADQERIDRRRAALDERERELSGRAIAPPVAAPPATTATDDDPGPRVRVLERLVADRERALQAMRERVDALEQREQAAQRATAAEQDRLAELTGRFEEQLAAARGETVELQARLERAERSAAEESQRAQTLERELVAARRLAASFEDRLQGAQEQTVPVAPPVREEPPVQAAPPPAVETPSEPEPLPVQVESPPVELPPAAPVLAPAAEGRSALEPEPGRWSLAALEAAAARYPDDPRAEEWATYALFLRDHVEPSGLLPVSFDGLVDEVYGDLIARVRAGA